MTRPNDWNGIIDGVILFAETLALVVEPPPALSVADWAEAKRRVSPESGSPYPGSWRNSLVPYLVEPMNCLSFSDPSRDIVFKKSHQVGGTEIGVNLWGYLVDQRPCPAVIVLPTIEEASKYDRIKLTPTIEATPELDAKVKAQRSRDDTGSTMSFKRYPGGFTQLVGANSSTGLQMISARVLIAEEISEWPADAGNRGDPLAQVEKRLTAWSLRGQKRYYSSTPAVVGNCRISTKYDASDMRRFYVACPQCGTHQTFRFDNLEWESDRKPHVAYFHCPRGHRIDHHQKKAMVVAGVWVKTYSDEGEEDLAPGPVIDVGRLDYYLARSSNGRDPGFAIWQAYSPFCSWDDIVADYLDSKGSPFKAKTFAQQDLGEAYEESGEAPDWEKLLARVEPYQLGKIPPGGLILTGMCDVQGDRLEWAVYAWGIGMTGWLVDKGIILGDPGLAATWSGLDEVVLRRYPDWQGNTWPIEAFGVDAGYLSNMVYLFCSRHGAQRVYALDGRGGDKLPPVLHPRNVSLSKRGQLLKLGVQLWPTGTWGLKSGLYSALRLTIAGPDDAGLWPLGCLHFPDACDEGFFKELTAEYLVQVEVKGGLRREWRKIGGQANEQLDIYVGARALAWHKRLDNHSAEDWALIARERGAPALQAQQDLAALWAPTPAVAARDAARAAQTQEATASTSTPSRWMR